MMHEYLIREIKPSEYPLLRDFLYEAILQRDGTQVVQKDNYTFHMYKKLGFEIVDENDEEYRMVYCGREGLL